MTDTIYNNAILCAALSFAEDKIRPNQTSDKGKFLSSLALVLNGTATCTAVYVHHTEKLVFIARNESITETDRLYFDRFFRQIRIYAGVCFDDDKTETVQEIDDQLRSLVLEYNWTKINNRLLDRKKLIADKLAQLAQSNTDEKLLCLNELQSNRTSYTVKPSRSERIHLMMRKRTDEDYVQFLFETLDRFLHARDRSIAKQEHEQLLTATRQATLLYESRLFRSVLNLLDATTGRGVHYFEKASGHYRAIDLFLKCLMAQKDRFLDIYKTISWKLIEPIEEMRPLLVTPKQAFERIFEDLQQSFKSSMTSQEFYAEHLQKLDRFEEDPVYHGHMHAEIVLIDYLLANGINGVQSSHEVEIGISKMSCLLCSYYIEELNKKHQRCFCSSDSTHGKVYPKWAHRKGEDECILNVINQKLVDKLLRAIRKVCVDSDRADPLKSGDSDIMWTSLEAEQFDAECFKRFYPSRYLRRRPD